MGACITRDQLPPGQHVSVAGHGVPGVVLPGRGSVVAALPRVVVLVLEAAAVRVRALLQQLQQQRGTQPRNSTHTHKDSHNK